MFLIHTAPSPTPLITGNQAMVTPRTDDVNDRRSVTRFVLRAALTRHFFSPLHLIPIYV